MLESLIILYYVTKIFGSALMSSSMCNVLYSHLQTTTVQIDQRNSDMVT